MPNLIGRFLGKYQILEQVGPGGIVAVYKAYQPQMDRYVAIKVFQDDLLRKQVILERFKRDAKTWINLRHPNIISPLEYGEEEGIPYRVEEYLHGSNLRHLLEQKPKQPLALAEAVSIVKQTLVALGHAHELGIVHHDVKPSNIFITQDGQALLMDFGLAKMVADTLGSDLAVSTPEYVAPEQAEGKTVDHRCDLYSLGVVFYQVATGRVPFASSTPAAVLMKLRAGSVPPPRQFNPNLPGGVERVLLKALCKNPADRYQTANEMIDAINKFVVTPEGWDTVSASDATALRQILAKRFNLEELRTLCVDLKVSYDSLDGEGQEAKARELIAFLQRRERLGELVEYIRQRRPDIKLA